MAIGEDAVAFPRIGTTNEIVVAAENEYAAHPAGERLAIGSKANPVALDDVVGSEVASPFAASPVDDDHCKEIAFVGIRSANAVQHAAAHGDNAAFDYHAIEGIAVAG